jgi:PAS domain S-box-containing protein
MRKDDVMKRKNRANVIGPAERIAIIYAVFGCLWILFSDKAMEMLFGYSERLLLKMSLYKGWFFIIVTAILVYLMVKGYIREKMRQEERASRMEIKYRYIAENSSDGIALTDERGKLIEWNRELHIMTGLSAEEAIGRYIWEMQAIILPKAETDRFPVDLIKQGVIDLLEGRGETGKLSRLTVLNKKTGALKVVELKIFTVKVETGVMLGSVIRDITFNYEAEQALKKSNEELEQFAYVASHDLQEPLRTVSNYAELLQRRYRGKIDNDADEFLGYMEESVQRMSRMIKDLLEYSRVGKNIQDFGVIDTSATVREVVDSMQNMVQQKGAKIIETGGLPRIQASRSHITRLFQNLIANGIKFNKSTFPEVTVTVEKIPNYWKFRVKDNGIGIDPAYNERIFGIFQQLHTKSEYEGTGIGLTICKKIVEKLGGSIWVESRIGEGSSFYFTIPDTVERPSGGVE